MGRMEFSLRCVKLHAINQCNIELLRLAITYNALNLQILFVRWVNLKHIKGLYVRVKLYIAWEWKVKDFFACNFVLDRFYFIKRCFLFYHLFCQVSCWY